MIGIGTIVNVLAIVVGGLIGLLFKGGGSLMRIMLRCGRATTSF